MIVLTKSKLLWSIPLAPVFGASVFFYGVFIYSGDRGWFEGSDTPNIPFTESDNFVAALSISFFIWTLFIVVLNSVFLVLSANSNSTIIDAKYQRIYKRIALISYVIPTVTLLIGLE